MIPPRRPPRRRRPRRRSRRRRRRGRCRCPLLEKRKKGALTYCSRRHYK